MEHRKLWQKKIQTKINQFREKFTKREIDRYYLDRLEAVASKVADFSGNCRECQDHRQIIESLIKDLENIETLGQSGTKEYRNKIENITNHLRKEHKIIPWGQNLALGVSLGLCFGSMLGLTLFDNMAIGLGIGLLLGIAIGSSMDMKAKKEGRTI